MDKQRMVACLVFWALLLLSPSSVLVPAKGNIAFLVHELKYTLAAYEHTTRGIHMFWEGQ
jgi:hypothetical protein